MEETYQTYQTYQKTIATLRALYLYYQTAHWLSLGSQYYGDHLLFERLYTATLADVDIVGEKALGITQNDEAVSLVKNLEMVTKIIGHMDHAPDAFFSSALKLEKAFIKLCDDQVKNDANSEGVKNMFAGFEDKHEGHVYLLQQRLKGLKVI